MSAKVLSIKVQFVQFLKCRSYKLQKMGTRAFGQLPLNFSFCEKTSNLAVCGNNVYIILGIKLFAI